MEVYSRVISAQDKQFSLEKISRIQNAKLQKLVHYSFNNIKYYRELFEQAGIKPEQIKTPADLANVPVLTKEELRERFWDFLPRYLPECRVSRTSGSTGVPVCILSDKNSRIYNSVAVIRYRRAMGIPIVGSLIITPLKAENDPNKEPHWTFLQGIHKTYYINPYLNNTESEIRLLRNLKDPILIGITPAVKALAYKINDGVLPFFKPVAILTSGEMLSREARLLLESTFGTKVFDIYACNEGGDIAWQCRESDCYHINADNCIVEILKNGKTASEGEVGEVVITNLNRFAMPIIRYKNGDLAELTYRPCSCGCKLPTIAKIVGRTGENIVIPGGKSIPWNQLKSLMNHPNIRQFQLVQNSDGGLVIRYVSEKGVDTMKLDKLLMYRYRNLIGNSIGIEIEKVEKIALGPGGKSKFVISNYEPANFAPSQNKRIVSRYEP